MTNSRVSVHYSEHVTDKTKIPCFKCELLQIVTVRVCGKCTHSKTVLSKNVIWGIEQKKFFFLEVKKKKKPG